MMSPGKVWINDLYDEEQVYVVNYAIRQRALEYVMSSDLSRIILKTPYKYHWWSYKLVTRT